MKSPAFDALKKPVQEVLLSQDCRDFFGANRILIGRKYKFRKLGDGAPVMIIIYEIECYLV